MSALVCLLYSFTQNLFAYALNLYIHLDSSNSVSGSRDLKVHIAKEIFQTLNIRKNGNFTAVDILYKTHRNACNRRFDRNACIHQCKCRTAYRRLRRRTVGRKDFGNKPYRIRELVFGRNNRLKSSFCQCSVTDFTPAGTP